MQRLGPARVPGGQLSCQKLPGLRWNQCCSASLITRQNLNTLPASRAIEQFQGRASWGLGGGGGERAP